MSSEINTNTGLPADHPRADVSNFPIVGEVELKVKLLREDHSELPIRTEFRMEAATADDGEGNTIDISTGLGLAGRHMFISFRGPKYEKLGTAPFAIDLMDLFEQVTNQIEKAATEAA